MDARVKPAHDEKGESMPYETILYDADGAVATITLNRPEQLNTIVPSMPDEIEAAVHEAVRGPNVKLIVLRGQGARSAAEFDFGAGFHQCGPVLTADGEWNPGRDFVLATAPTLSRTQKFMSLWRAPRRRTSAGARLVCRRWLGLCAVRRPRHRGRGRAHRHAVFAAVGRVSLRHVDLSSRPHRVKEHALTGKPLSGKEAAEVGLISRAVPLVSAMRRSQQPRNSSPAFRCRSSPP